MHHNYFILFQFWFFCHRLQRPNESEIFGQNTANNVALAIAKKCTYCYLATLFCTLFSPCLCPSKLLPLLNSISKWDWTHVKMSLQIFSASHSWSQFQFLLCNSDFFFWSLKPVHTKKQKNEIRKIVFELRKQARFGSVCQPFKPSLKPKVTIV